jgi:hypothetical protein
MAPPRADLKIIRQSLWRDSIIIAVMWPGTSQAWHKAARKGGLVHIYSCLRSFMAHTFPGVMLHIETHQRLLVQKRFDPTCLEFRSISWDVPIQELQIVFPSTDKNFHYSFVYIFFVGVWYHTSSVSNLTLYRFLLELVPVSFQVHVLTQRRSWKSIGYYKIIFSRPFWTVFWNGP